MSVPHEPTETWLREQLSKLQTLRYRDARHALWPYIEIFEDGPESTNSTLFLLASADCVFDGDRYLVFRAVVFEQGNVAYVGPDHSIEGGKDLASPFDDDYRQPGSSYDKVNWAQGLCSLANSLTSHVSGIKEEDARQLSEALHRFRALPSERIAIETR